MNPYIGHESQLYGIEEHRLVGGKGDGLRLLEVRNGLGMELTVSLDRCCDIPRLTHSGTNMNYISPCGYVAPAYYRSAGEGWLKSFTAGFLTTCGLESVGRASVDDGEEAVMHGSIANVPASDACWYEEDGELVIRATVRDEVIFGRKLRLYRQIRVSLTENRFRICDTVENTGNRREPFEMLYHMNMGYPLLDEDSVVAVPGASVTPRDAHAAAGLADCLKMEKPQPGYQERCYYYRFADEKGEASIYQPKLNKGLRMRFDARLLDGFVEWKMMGYRDYVLGLECGNCYPDGRDEMRRIGMLKFLNPSEKIRYEVDIELF